VADGECWSSSYAVASISRSTSFKNLRINIYKFLLEHRVIDFNHNIIPFHTLTFSLTTNCLGLFDLVEATRGITSLTTCGRNGSKVLSPSKVTCCKVFR